MMRKSMILVVMMLCAVMTSWAQNTETKTTTTIINADGSKTIRTTTTKSTVKRTKVTRRPFSLYSLMATSAALDESEVIKKAFEQFVPEKDFNSFNLAARFINLDNYENLAQAEEGKLSKLKNIFKKVKKTAKIGANLLGYKTASEQVKADMDKMPSACEQFFAANNTADSLDLLWHSNDTLKHFASQLEEKTYVVVMSIRCRPNSELADDVTRTAKIASTVTGGGLLNPVTNVLAKQAASSIAGEGYSVVANSLVYQLVKDNDKVSLKYLGTLSTRNIIRQKNGGEKSDDELLSSVTSKLLQTVLEDLENTYIGEEQ